MPHDAASLLRRAYSRGPSLLRTQSLVGTVGQASGALVTLSTPQQLIQEIDETETSHNRRQDEVSPHGLADTTRKPPRLSDYSQSIDVELLLRELCDFREALGDESRCVSTDERAALSTLREQIVTALVRRIITEETKGDDVRPRVQEACTSLLTLSVRPSAVAREVAFELMLELSQAVACHSPTLSPRDARSSDIHRALFLCFADMLVKSVAVAGTEAGQTIASNQRAWVLNAVACASAFVERPDRKYQADRLQKLTTSALLLLLRRAIFYSMEEPAIVEALVELIFCKMYSGHSPNDALTVGACRSSLAVQSRTPADTAADLDMFGGADLYLTIFYTTPSCQLRRLLLFAFFDLAVGRLRRNKSNEDENAWVSYDSLLRNLQNCDFADMIATTPALVASLAASGGLVKNMHALVENDLLEKHVAMLWTALRESLRVDEHFVHSQSLSNTLKVLSHSTRQPHETVSDLILTKVQQLLSAERPEDRFKGERWLAELLTHGLDQGNHSNQKGYEGELILQENSSSKCELEDSLCFDENAEIRLGARMKLWELSRSPIALSRISFTRVLSLVARRLGTQSSTFTRDLNICLEALVAGVEDSPAVLVSAVDLVLLVLVSPHEVPYIDRNRRVYDRESTNAPKELTGKLVGSSSLAAKVLVGSVSVDRSLLSHISVDFFLHTLRVLGPSGCTIDGGPCNGGSCAVDAVFVGDCAAAVALLISYALQDAPPQSLSPRVLSPFLNSCDSRIAVFAAHSVVAQVKREYGQWRYLESVRSLHAAAVQGDDDASLASAVAHARAVLQFVQELTP